LNADGTERCNETVYGLTVVTIGKGGLEETLQVKRHVGDIPAVAVDEGVDGLLLVGSEARAGQTGSGASHANDVYIDRPWPSSRRE
jgi:hypothetical protein